MQFIASFWKDEIYGEINVETTVTGVIEMGNNDVMEEFSVISKFLLL